MSKDGYDRELVALYLCVMPVSIPKSTPKASSVRRVFLPTTMDLWLPCYGTIVELTDMLLKVPLSTSLKSTRSIRASYWRSCIRLPLYPVSPRQRFCMVGESLSGDWHCLNRSLHCRRSDGASVDQWILSLEDAAKGTNHNLRASCQTRMVRDCMQDMTQTPAKLKRQMPRRQGRNVPKAG